MADQMTELLSALDVPNGQPEWNLGNAAVIPMTRWGKDHWTTFLYVETRWVDHHGFLSHDQMRCDRGRHPAFYGAKRRVILVGPQPDGSKYATRLKTAEPRPDGTWGTEELFGHDDYDCLDDAISEGLIEVFMPRHVEDDYDQYRDSKGRPVVIPGGELISASMPLTGLTELWLMTAASFGLTAKGQEISGELRAHVARTRRSHQFMPSCLVTP